MQSDSDTAPVIVWFRQDLRVADHPTLTAAAAAGPVIPLFILDDENAHSWKPGGASRWWLEGSLAALDADLRARGSQLILRHGKAAQILDQVISETGAASVFLTRRYEPFQAAQDQIITDTFANQGITCRRFGGSLLFEPEAVQT